TRLDRVDQCAHPLPASSGEIRLLGCSPAALTNMRRGPTFARIDYFPGEQSSEGASEVHALGASQKFLDDPLIEVRLRPIEIQPCDLEGQPAQAVGLVNKELVEPFHRGMLLFGRHRRGT